MKLVIRPRSWSIISIFYILSSIKNFLSKWNLDCWFVRNTKPIISELLLFSKDHKYVFEKLIFLSKPIKFGKTRSVKNVEIHSMIGPEAVSFYVLCIRSFIHYSEIAPRIVVHSDRVFQSRYKSLLRRKIPN